MTERIAVGDLVVVVKGCCNAQVGTIWPVTRIEPFHNWEICVSCKAVPPPGLAGCYGNIHAAHLSWLKRIPPLSELEGAQEWYYITNPEDIPA